MFKSIPMSKLEMPLLTEKYSKIFHEVNFNYNAPNHFIVTDKDHKDICTINFQEGPIKECGVNGVMNEDLINMVICRLQHFQDTDFRCRENACAITKLEEALMWLRLRTDKREARGVVGTHEI